VVQLLLLASLLRHGWNATLANGVAFLLAAQLNFALSVTITWRDRAGSGSLQRRWLLFHASIAVMALVNMLTFTAARSFLPTLAASVAGIAAGALGNFLAGDRIIFRGSAESTSTPKKGTFAA
jgi:putative flippase GtrA